MANSWSDTHDADIKTCGDSLRCGSRTFFAASTLLPRKIYEPAAALYAFCRLADDVVDEAGGPVSGLQDRLRAAYAGNPLPVPADRALAAVVAHHAIPATLPEALLDGFEWDAAGRRYQTLGELQDYAARVAGTVGAMMAMLMGARAPDVIARACDLGVAMQFSNIARDVGEDARAGRVYLPLDWMEEAGLDPDAFLADPKFSPQLGQVIARLLREADILYRRADAGIARLPASCRPGIAAARLLYAEIGQEVARRGFDSVTSRAVVSPARKLRVLARVLVHAIRPRFRGTWPALEAVRFLVDSASAAPMARVARRKNFDERMAWLVDLLIRLEERQQSQA
jgi:phytoene synthase